MCIIAFKPKGVELPANFYDKMKVMMTKNRDGVGMAIKRNDNSVIHVIKGLYSIDDMINIVKRAYPNKQDEFLFHARIGTSGKDDKFNCHPFYVNQKLSEVVLTDSYRRYPVIAHNGIFSCCSKGRIENYSDTVHFIIQFLALDRYFKVVDESPALFEKLFSEEISYNKFVILYPECHKQAYIFNKKMFEECDGLFYSNSGHRLPIVNTNTSQTAVAGFVQQITHSKRIKKGSETYTIAKNSVMKTVGNLSVVGCSLRKGFIELDEKNPKRFIFGENHPLYNYKRGESKEIQIVSDKKETYRIVDAYKTGLHLINVDTQELMWLNPVELLINYTLKNVE